MSLPGKLAVKRVDGVPMAFPAEGGHVAPEENLLRVVYDCGPVPVRVPRSGPAPLAFWEWGDGSACGVLSSSCIKLDHCSSYL